MHATIDVNTSPAATGNEIAAQARLRMRRFRAAHPRIDYAPAADVQAWVERIREVNPGASYSEILDNLIRKAKTVVSGNIAGNK